MNINIDHNAYEELTIRDFEDTVLYYTSNIYKNIL